MPENTGNFIRSLLKEEAGAATFFIQQNANDGYALSYSFCLHHSETIFICTDAAGEWHGIIATYLSPSERNKAVIESVVVAAKKRRVGIAGQLFAFILQYYKQQCVFNISMSMQKIPVALQALLTKFSFRPGNETTYTKHLLPEKICLHNRYMRPRMNTINGEISEDTLFEYFQKDDVVWGTYSGGTILRGVLLGRMAKNGDINFQYLQLNNQNEVNTGISHSATEFLNDGRIILYEDWEWTGNRSGGGRSVIEEIKE